MMVPGRSVLLEIREPARPAPRLQNTLAPGLIKGNLCAKLATFLLDAHLEMQRIAGREDGTINKEHRNAACEDSPEGVMDARDAAEPDAAESATQSNSM